MYILLTKTKKCYLKLLRLASILRPMHFIISASLKKNIYVYIYIRVGIRIRNTAFCAHTAARLDGKTDEFRGFGDILGQDQCVESVKMRIRIRSLRKMRIIIYFCRCLLLLDPNQRENADPQHWPGRLQPKKRKKKLH